MQLKKIITATSCSLLSLAAVSASAQAATVTTDLPCYDVFHTSSGAISDTVSISGTGYTPSAPFSAVLDGSPLGDSTVDASGAISGSFSAPNTIAEGAPSETHQVDISDGTNSASATFEVSNFEANMLNSSGNLLKKKIRFQIHGFGQGSSAYVHYLDPKGKHKKTVRLGKTTGVCGDLKTKKRKALPFKKPRKGVWTLQFDTAKKYSSKTLSYIQQIKVSSVRVSSIGEVTKLR